MKFMNLKAKDLKAGDVYTDDGTGSFGLIHGIRRIPDGIVISFTLPLYNLNDGPDEWAIDEDRWFDVVRFEEKL